MSPSSLAEMAQRIAASQPPLESVEFGPWLGSWRASSPDLVGREYMTAGSNFLWVPRGLSGPRGDTYGTFRRRGGQTKLFDAGNTGLLPAQWLDAAAPLNAKARSAEEFLNTTLTSDGVPTTAWLVTKEAFASGLDDGRFSQLYIRDQVANSNYTYGSEFGTDTYPDPGAEQAYKIIPLWYDSGDGGITRGASEFARRFFFCGSRRFLKVGRWHYSPSVNGTPSRALIERGVGEGVPISVLPVSVQGSVNSWRGQDAGTTNLQNYVNEVTPSDATYVTETGGSAGSELNFVLWTTGNTPFSGSPNVTIHFRVKKASAVGVETFAFKLTRGATPVVTETNAGVLTSASFAPGYSYTLSAAEVALLLGAGDVVLDIFARNIGATGYDVSHILMTIGEGTVTSSNRLIPSGPLPPLHAGTITPGSVVASVSGATQTMRPDADTTAGGWTATGAASLFGALNETTPSDTQYISCAGGGALCKIRLSDPAITPGAGDTVTLRFRAAFTIIAKTLTVQLYQTTGPTLRASKVITLTSAYVDYTYTLTAAEVAAITDWTALELQLTVGAGAGAGVVSYAALTDDSLTTAGAGWTGKDRFYRSVAYRFEDGSVWAFCTPRAPNDILADGYNLTTIDAANPTTAYSSILWQHIPIGVHGTVSRLLLRTDKIDSTTEDTAQLDPHTFNVVAEIKDNVTTEYEDFFADDDSLLSGEVVDLFIREDHIMPPRARYIFGGDMRVCHSYCGLNPCAIEIAPVGMSADYDRNLVDTDSNAYEYPTGRMLLTYDASTGDNLLELHKVTSGGDTAVTIDLDTYDTLQKLVDRINVTTFSDASGQWRAQLCPGVNADASSVNSLTPQAHILGFVFYTSGSATLTKPDGGLSAVPVGARIFGSAAWTSQYVIRVVSDTEITLSANAPSTGSDELSFWPVTELTTGAATDDIAQRVIANSLPGFLYFNKTYLDADPVHKQDVFMTVAQPGSAKSAANCFSGKQSNRFAPPNANAGISMGGAACDRGFVTPYANAIYSIRNTRDTGSGVDADYRQHAINESRGCCAWNTVTPGNRFVPYLTPHGMFAADLEREVLLSEAVWKHPQSDATLGTGDWDSEIPKCMAASAADTDAAYATARVLRSAIRINYRDVATSTSLPDKQVKYDFSGGVEHAGIAALLRPDGTPWGWSNEMAWATHMAVMVAARRGDGDHLYGWNEANAGSTGDGRIDEFETGETDNGTEITGSIVTPWEKGDENRQVSGQEVLLEHTSPAGSTGALDFTRSYSEDLYSLTPGTSALVVLSEPKLLPQAARVASRACKLGYRQLTGPAREVRKMTLRLFRIRAYK